MMATPDNIPPTKPETPPVPRDDVPRPAPDDREQPDKRVPDDVDVPDDVVPGSDADIDRGGTRPRFENDSVSATRDEEEEPGNANPSPMNPAFP